MKYHNLQGTESTPESDDEDQEEDEDDEESPADSLNAYLASHSTTRTDNADVPVAEHHVEGEEGDTAASVHGGEEGEVVIEIDEAEDSEPVTAQISIEDNADSDDKEKEGDDDDDSDVVEADDEVEDNDEQLDAEIAKTKEQYEEFKATYSLCCPVEGCDANGGKAYSHQQSLNRHLKNHHQELASWLINHSRISFTNLQKTEINKYWEELKGYLEKGAFNNTHLLSEDQQKNDIKLLEDVKREDTEAEKGEGIDTEQGVSMQERKAIDSQRYDCVQVNELCVSMHSVCMAFAELDVAWANKSCNAHIIAIRDNV